MKVVMEPRDAQQVNGKGLYATKSYKKDQVVFVLSGPILGSPTRESIHIGYGLHVLDKFGVYMNHSFNPTTRIDGNRVRALIDISPDDELTFNYNDSEVEMACPFTVEGQLVGGRLFERRKIT